MEELTEAIQQLSESVSTTRGVSPSDLWLDADQAVAYLRLPSRKALYQTIRRGVIPAHRMGRLLRFNRNELDHHLTGGRSA